MTDQLPPPPSASNSYAPIPAELSKPSNGLGVASFTVALFALVVSWMPGLSYLMLLVAMVAILLGILGLARTGRQKGLAIAGTSIGGLALLLALIFSIGWTATFARTGQETRESSSPAAQTQEKPEPASPEASPSESPRPADSRTPVTFTADGDGNTPPQRMGPGNYAVAWETRGDCYYSVDVEGPGSESLFTADAATTGTGYVYELVEGAWHLDVITGPAPGCGYTVTFAPAE